MTSSMPVILGGALWVLRPLGMPPMAVSCLATLAVSVAALAAADHGFVAIWPRPAAISNAWGYGRRSRPKPNLS